MSDNLNPSPHDAAIAVISERARELDADILGHQRCIDVATARRDELLDLVATLSRKPRARKPRAVTEATPSAMEEAAPRPSVFAAPCDVAEAA
jgi:hypothetical protein